MITTITAVCLSHAYPTQYTYFNNMTDKDNVKLAGVIAANTIRIYDNIIFII